MTKRKSQTLYQLCKELPYSKENELSDEIFNETKMSLNQLLSQYGYAYVLGQLATIWSLDKAIKFFSKLKLITNKKGEIKTIATNCIRAYHGGIERVNAQLMTLWIQMGYKVVLFTEEAENILDYPYPSTVKRLIIPPATNLTERLATIQKYCIDEKVDLFVNHTWWELSVLWECMMLKMMHIPYIQYVHGHFSHFLGFSKNYLCQPQVFKLCDIVLSLSETNARFYQLCGCNSYIVQNPIPEDLSNSNALSNLDSKHILWVGRLEPDKNPMDALKIFRLVHKQQSDVILDIVGGSEDGGGELISNLKSYVLKYNLQNNVIFHGKKEQSEIEGFYLKAFCVLFTSEMEGYPMVVLESKAYGLPLVMYELPYLTLCKDGKGILTAPIGNIEQMADHILYLLENDSYRRSVGQSARESFDIFNANNLADTWNNIIKLCSSDKREIDDLSYFNPANVNYADRLIEPALLESVKNGYNSVLINNIDYKIGHKILKFPRAIVNLIREVRREISGRKNDKCDTSRV